MPKHVFPLDFGDQLNKFRVQVAERATTGGETQKGPPDELEHAITKSDTPIFRDKETYPPSWNGKQPDGSWRFIE